MDENLKTYNGWLATGRAVRAGEQANCYLLSPDGDRRKALFHLDQTAENTEAAEIADWTTIVFRDDLLLEQRRLKRKKLVRIEYTTQTQQLAIWVGPDTELIKWLKQGGYRFRGASHRWVALRGDWQTFVQRIAERRPDVRFEVTVDGAAVSDPLEQGL